MALSTMKSENRQIFFRQNLMEWFKTNDRPLPWKGEKNPYFIWLSEIILQQTRVEQGMPYFHRFKDNYPTVQDLANAPEDQVMKSWEGLGYYSRARNLHAAAKHIAFELEGKFPNTYQDILSLKGVGPYTAAAISSFAFNLPHAVVDGNVYRVLSRVFDIDTPIDSTPGKKQFSKLANELIAKDRPGAYNQAIMDFGATICLPLKPKCNKCPMQLTCLAFQSKKISDRPVKLKKIRKRARYFYYLVGKYKEYTYIKKRIEKDIWQNLYEFPMIELKQQVDLKDFVQHSGLKNILKESGFEIQKFSKPFKQQLTHQKIIATFIEITLSDNNFNENGGFIEINQKNISNFAFPKVIGLYLADKSLYLNLF